MENVNVKIINEEIYAEKPLKSLDVLTQTEPLTASTSNLINLSTDIISSDVHIPVIENIEISSIVHETFNDSILFENPELNQVNINQENLFVSLKTDNNVSLVEQSNIDVTLTSVLNFNIENMDLNFEHTAPTLQINIENLNI